MRRSSPPRRCGRGRPAPRQGDQRTAAGLATRADRLLEQCEGARSPSLVTAHAGVRPLTEREREIALLAAAGLSAREIAERLYLSYRTVNNHLQHVYDKVGARGRAELRAALGLEESGMTGGRRHG